MAVQVSLRNSDVADVESDLLLLKHARGFHGADQQVAARLIQQGVGTEASLAPGTGESVLVESHQAVKAKRVLFLGTPRLAEFRYAQMRRFARRAIELIGEHRLPIRVLTTTVHGAGYGLDIEESLQAMMYGFQQGIASGAAEQLEQIVFVEASARRFRVLDAAIKEFDLVRPPVAPAAVQEGRPATVPQVNEPRKKKCVFVAMPFTEEFDDVYQFGIYAAVRRCGYVCERVDESAFAGNIVDRITEGIRHAEFVVADLTQEKPNVYLEVGFAWGLRRPVILVAREGQRLHFDLSHHRCIFYRTIGKLAESLEQTIRDLQS